MQQVRNKNVKNFAGFRQAGENSGDAEAAQAPLAVEAGRAKLSIGGHGRGSKPPAGNGDQIALMRAESREILRAAWLR